MRRMSADAMVHWVECLAILALLAMLVLAHRRATSLARRTRRLETLAELSELLQLSSSSAEVVELLPLFGRKLFALFDGAVYTVRSSPGSLELAAWWQGDPNRRGPRFLTFPMLAAGESMGVMTLSGPIEQIDRRCAERFTNQIGLALATQRLQDSLRSLAVRDALTGVFNRRYLEETLLRELLRGERAHRQVGIIVADVDHFKTFNDTWGHAGGDAVLRQLARVMQRVFRESDVICRYGGEEFVIVVPDTTLDALHAAADRFREEVRRMNIQFEGRLLDEVTISAGIALSPDHGTTVEALFAQADRALYAAKRDGRNRVAAPPFEGIGRDAA